jgi:hypothetical protein
MRKLSVLLLVTGLLVAAASPLAAQTPRPGQPTPEPMVQQTPPPSGVGVIPPPQPPRAPALPSITANIKLDLTITDTYTGTPTKKTVSMLILNGSNGMIRTSNRLHGVPVGLNVDAAATIHQGGLITVRITFEYTPAQAADERTEKMVATGLASAGAGRPNPAELHESLSVILQDGKPLLVSQSADPATDRKVTVELVATVLK